MRVQAVEHNERWQLERLRDRIAALLPPETSVLPESTPDID